MLNYENAMAMVPENKKESVKCIVQDLGATMNEIHAQLLSIKNSIIGPEPIETNKRIEPEDACMIDALQRLRNEAQTILGTVVSIREGLF